MNSIDQLMLTLPLIMLRLGPIFVVSGIQPLSHVPLLVRTFLVLILAFVVVSNISGPVLPTEADRFLLIAVKELMLGLLLVIGVQAAFAAISTLAHLLDNQFGLTAAGILNPATQTSDGPIATLFAWLAAVVFFESGAHIELLSVVVHSYSLLPIDTKLTHVHAGDVVSIVGFQFVLAFLLVLPVVAVLFLLDVAIGFASKSMPSVNIYFLSLPLKIVVGVLTLMMIAPGIYRHISRMFTTAIQLTNSTNGG